MTSQQPQEPGTAAPETPDASRRIPEAGMPAPDVALPDETGTVRRLGDQRGRWTILYFYPEDDTTGCTTEACQFRDIHEDIVDSDADVWGVSPDGAASHERFKTKYGLPFTLLADVDHAVSTAYGAWGLKNNYGHRSMGIVRSSFLIDPKGRIAKVWPRVKADGHAAEVLAALAEAKASPA
ncbi:MAG TPA: peroxiredoxin [Candidatus Saccharimonadales bacterium]|nr:peroxiredoxin [Candidatus Saccharimonadales bacterium]